jgi:hypothetical protein
VPQPRRRRTSPAAERIALGKDVGSFLVGAFMMIQQTLSDQPNIAVLLVGFAALGVAGSGAASRVLDRFSGPKP